MGAAIFAFLFVVVACDADRGEAERVISTVERYRRADNAEKPALADSIRAVPCSAADVCQARDACAASAEPTSKALRLKHEVEVKLAAVERGDLPRESPEAQALPAKLDEAESLLKEGFDHLQPCDDAILALRRKHRI
ncbi:MAG TPA: hypothetical protein VIF62_17710 [Labilithrix sp.]